MRLMILALIAVVMCGCEADPIRQAKSANPKTTVDVVTEFDGIRLYRVNVGDRSVFVAAYVNGLNASWDEQHAVSTGKTTMIITDHFETETL